MMKSSWRIARVAGVGIDIHWSFSFIILWVLVQSAFEERELWNTLLFLSSVLLVFVCIVLHEIGHALMALSLKVRVKNIMVLPFGGLAQIESVPDRPLYEFLIAAAGPLVNLVIVALLVPMLMLLAGPILLNSLLASPAAIVDRIIIAYFQESSLLGLVVLMIMANVVLFAFNLMPALPMDGGRILRALLTPLFSYLRATQITMVVGFVVAVGLILAAFERGNFFLMLVAMFILFASRPMRAR